MKNLGHALSRFWEHMPVGHPAGLCCLLGCDPEGGIEKGIKKQLHKVGGGDEDGETVGCREGDLELWVRPVVRGGLRCTLF